MRRVLGTVLAFLVAVLTAGPATAAPPKGEIVFVANGGAGYADLNLPAKVTPNFDGAMYRTGGYVLLTAGPGRDVTGFMVVAPGGDWPWGFGYLPKGRSRVRILTDRPTTIHVPVTGIRGRVTVRLDRKLSGAVAKTADATVGVNAARSELPFTPSGRSVVFHGYTSYESKGAGRHDWLCLGAPGMPCIAEDPTDVGGTVVGGPWSEAGSIHTAYEHEGPAASKLLFADAGTTGPVKHFLLAYPLV